jgi:hypothetical protein
VEVIDGRYERARKRAEELRGFYTHLCIYAIVNIGIFAVNMLTNPHSLWFYWPLLGWGIGLAIHAFVTMAGDRFLGDDWQERKTRELMRRYEDESALSH